MEVEYSVEAFAVEADINVESRAEMQIRGQFEGIWGMQLVCMCALRRTWMLTMPGRSAMGSAAREPEQIKMEAMLCHAPRACVRKALMGDCLLRFLRWSTRMQMLVSRDERVAREDKRQSGKWGKTGLGKQTGRQ